MTKLLKADREKLFIEHLLSIGISRWCKTYEKGNYYYLFDLEDGSRRYWTNLSSENESKIKEQEAQND